MKPYQRYTRGCQDLRERMWQPARSRPQPKEGTSKATWTRRVKRGAGGRQILTAPFLTGGVPHLSHGFQLPLVESAPCRLQSTRGVSLLRHSWSYSCRTPTSQPKSCLCLPSSRPLDPRPHPGQALTPLTLQGPEQMFPPPGSLWSCPPSFRRHCTPLRLPTNFFFPLPCQVQ